MGNAREFMANKDNRKKYRKGSHNKKCQNKIDNYLEDHEATQCEDYDIVQVGMQRENHRVNEMQIFRGTIDGIHARMQKKKEERPCECCGKPFRPIKFRRPATVAERAAGIGRDTIWCERCRQKGTEYRNSVKRAGGVEMFKKAKAFYLTQEELLKSDSLRVLFEQENFRQVLGRGSKGIRKRIERVIENAHTENENYIKHYEFDF